MRTNLPIVLRVIAVCSIVACCAPFSECYAAPVSKSAPTATIQYQAARGILPESNADFPFAQSTTGTADFHKGTSSLVTVDSDDKADGRFYWLPRKVIQEALSGHKNITLAVVCDVPASMGHVAASSVRLFVPSGGARLGPLTKDVHRAGYQDVIELGQQIGFGLVADGENHSADEVVLLDFGATGPHREMGRVRVSLDEPRMMKLTVRADGAGDAVVNLHVEGAPNPVQRRLSEFASNETADDFGLAFGHLTSPGTAEVHWHEIKLDAERGGSRPIAERPESAPRAIGSKPQLFADDWLIADMDGVTREQGKPVKSRKNPVLRRDRPWEDSRCELYGSSVWNPQSKKLQLFYSAMKQPYDSRVAYAESSDYGVTWTKPELDVFPWEGKPSNIVYPGRYWAHGPTVLFDEHEPDPNKRYKLLVTAAAVDHTIVDQGPRGMDAAHSLDGIHWTTAAGNPVIPDFVSDTGNCVIWDEPREMYRAYIRLRGNAGRAVGITESKDFAHWSEPRLIFWPSAEDRKVKNEFYGLSVTPYGDLYIGLVWVFPSTPESADLKLDSPVTWPELVVSRDGEHWERPFEGKAFLPLGKKGEFDSRQIRPASSMTVVPNRIIIMYSGSPHAHVAGHLWDIGLANLRPDGFAAIVADGQEGTLLTNPIVYSNGQLSLNANVSADGFLRVEVLDKDGRPVPGYTAQDCNALTDNGIRQTVTWQNHKTLPESSAEGQRLRISMKNAKLYSLRTVPSSARPGK